MKTQIIRLEPYDDLYSAKDKMGWGQTARILLVWPARGKVLNRTLDLILIKRHSAELGAQLALVVRTADIRHNAEILGIPVYSSARQAEKSHWRPERRLRSAPPQTVKRQSPEKWRKRRIPLNLDGLKTAAHPRPAAWLFHPITRILAFTLGVLAVLAIAALLVPSATVYLDPETEIQKITISVSASPKVQSVELSGAIPAHAESVIVEGRGSLPTSGSIPLPDHRATGEAQFINLTEQSIPLSEGTLVSTLDAQPIRFVTTASAAIPPGAEGATVPIEAILPGSSGNVPAESIQAIEGALGLDLTVINPAPTRGGTNRQAPAPTEADYQKLYEQLYQTLAEKALEEVGAVLEEGDLLLDQSLTLVTELEKSYSPTEVSPTDLLQLVLRLEFQLVTITHQDIATLGLTVLETNLLEGMSGEIQSLKITHLSTPNIGDDSLAAHWRMQAQWQTTAQIDAAQATTLALGLPGEQAEARLNAELPLDGPAQVILQPSWWPRTPVLPFRISIISGSQPSN